jgi:16S rRNA (uracil1498-N3)-methyltransferase
MHRVHVPGARPPSARVTGGEVVHLTRVLRLSAGDEVVVFDGLGREWLARIAVVSRSSVAIDLVTERAAVAEPSVHLTLGVAVLKGAQLDDVVRDATMLGASAIIPFVSARVAVSDRGWKNRSTERWQRVAASSASQSGRAFVPEIGAVTTFESVLSKGDVDLIVVCVEPTAGSVEPVTTLRRVQRVLLLVGPEGGWAHDELERARSKGAAFVTLGPRTLRAVAAPTVALAALWTHWGWE